MKEQKITAKAQESDKLLGLMAGVIPFTAIQNLYESIWNETYFYNCNGTILKIKMGLLKRIPVFF